ncbi:aminotransferase class V-fold PLP-dependent enzyme [Actinokineospora sp. 24-640]
MKFWEPDPGWLNTASHGIPPRRALDALVEPLDEWRRGAHGWAPWDKSTGRAREAFAQLVGADVADISVGASASQVIAPVAASLPRGARVVAPDIEQTSNLFPWLANDLDVRMVPPCDIPEAIDKRTDVVAFSVVQSATGEVAPVAEIVAAARANDALVVGDATQAAGWLPLDAKQFDVLAVSGYKWLMCPRGTAFCYFNARIRDRIRPIAANWYAGQGDASYGPPLRLAPDARRFDIAVPWFSYVAAAPTLELLVEIGVEPVHEHNLRLANLFRSGLGMDLGDTAIVCTSIQHAAERLAAAGIRVSSRFGRTRVAFHLYNTDRDVTRALRALA